MRKAWILVWESLSSKKLFLKVHLETHALM